MTGTARNYLLHFEGIDGPFTLERELVGGYRAAYALAQELAAPRLFCVVRGVELADEPILFEHVKPGEPA